MILTIIPNAKSWFSNPKIEVVSGNRFDHLKIIAMFWYTLLFHNPFGTWTPFKEGKRGGGILLFMGDFREENTSLKGGPCTEEVMEG